MTAPRGRRLRACAAIALALAACAVHAQSGFAQSRLKKALLLTHNNFHGPTTASTIALLQRIAKEKGFALDTVPDGSRFTDAGLAPYQAVLFVQNRTFGLSDPQKAAFERWFKQGNGALCVHACTLDQGWPYYRKILGTSLGPHSDVIATDVAVPGRAHPALKSYRGEKLNWDDEWFYWTSDPRDEPGVEALLTVDFSGFPAQTYPVPTLNGKPYQSYPNAWTKRTDSGRFLTWGGTHTTTVGTKYPSFTYDFYLNGLKWLAGADTVQACSNPALCDPLSGTSLRGNLPASPGNTQATQLVDIRGHKLPPAATPAPGIYFRLSDRARKTIIINP